MSILEEEDTSGWIKARTNDGREGLIPGSYLSEVSDGPALEEEEEAVTIRREGLFISTSFLLKK